MLNQNNNDNAYYTIGRILYQTAEAVKIYLLEEDKNIWVAKQHLANRMDFYSGQEIEFELKKTWIN